MRDVMSKHCMSCPDLEVEHVAIVACPLVGSGFSEYLPRTRKASINIKTRLKNGHLNLYENKMFENNLTPKNLPKIWQRLV